MTSNLTHRPRQISIDTAVTLRLRRAGWLRSPDGRAWLTRTHGGGDLILAPGAWQWVEPGTRWVVEPLHPHQVLPPGRPKAGQPPRGAANEESVGADVLDRPLRLEWQPLPSRWAAWRLVWRNLVDRLRGEAAWDDAVRPCDRAARVLRSAAPCAEPRAA